MSLERPGRLVGVRFERAGRVQFFQAEEELELEDQVVVEGERGQEVGWVVVSPAQVLHAELKEPLRRVLRKAQPEDLERMEELRGKAGEALGIARLKARTLGLPLKLVEARYTLGGDRLLLFYTTEAKGDFRELIRSLGQYLRVRLELRQVGPRDEAKALGGIGRCGRTVCCAAWLTRFDPVSIRMAKEQSLPVNAEHLAGQCGRLKCCLRYEYEQYRAVNRSLPKIGEWVMTPKGRARVLVGHAVKETVSVVVDGQEAAQEFPVSQLTRLPVETG